MNFLSLILTDSWILVKILQPNCLPLLSNCKIEETTVQLLFSLSIQFSTIEIRSAFSHAKLMISWLKWLGKNLGCPSSLVSYSHFSTDRTQYEGKSAMFSMCTCTSAREWRHKLCAVRMRNANVRNHLTGPLTDSCARSRALLRRWNFTSGYLRQPELGK